MVKKELTLDRELTGLQVAALAVLEQTLLDPGQVAQLVRASS